MMEIRMLERHRIKPARRVRRRSLPGIDLEDARRSSARQNQCCRGTLSRAGAALPDTDEVFSLASSESGGIPLVRVLCE
jgi:hypothetical protein